MGIFGVFERPNQAPDREKLLVHWQKLTEIAFPNLHLHLYLILDDDHYTHIDGGGNFFAPKIYAHPNPIGLAWGLCAGCLDIFNGRLFAVC